MGDALGEGALWLGLASEEAGYWHVELRRYFDRRLIIDVISVDALNMILTRYFRRLELVSSYWKDIAWVISGNGAANLLAMIALPLLTRLYEAEDFAIQALFIQMVGVVTILVTYRFELLVQLPKQSADATAIMLLVAVLAAGSVALASPLVFWFRHDIANFLGEEQLAVWLVLVPVTAALLAVALGVQHFLQRNQLYRIASLSELASKGSYIAIALFGYWLLPRPGGLIFAQSGASIGKLIFLLTFKRDSIRAVLHRPDFWQYLESHWSKVWALVKQYFKMTSGLVHSHLMQAGALLMPSAFILKTYGADSLGQYALVLATIFLPSGLIGKAIGKVYYQRAAKQFSDRKDLTGLWNTTASKVIFLGLPIYLIVGISAPYLYPLLFGKSWVLAGSIAQVMAVSAFVSFVTSPFGATGVVVGAWWYPPLWGTLRFALIGMAIWLAGDLSLTLMEFVVLLVGQQTLIYLIDGIAQRIFVRNASPKA